LSSLRALVSGRRFGSAARERCTSKGKGVLVTISVAETYRLRPGGLDGARSFFKDTRRFVESLGGKNVRVMHPIGGGERVNDIILTWEFADGAAFMKFHEDFMAAPEREQMLKGVTATDAPVEHVSSLILNEVTTM
jgi:hypothetical protein